MSRWSDMKAQLRAEASLYPWKGALVRMAVDFVLLNASMVGAFVIWFFVYLLYFDIRYPQPLAETFRAFIRGYWLLWSLLGLVILQLSGFYTRTRGYASRYKAWVIFRAVSLLVVSFVFLDYLLFRGALIPRGVAIIAWVLTLLTVGGSRLVKSSFLKGYELTPRPGLRRPRSVLVVGGAGYLGSHLVRELLARGYKARVLDSLLFGSKSVDDLYANPNFELMRGDVRDIETVVHAMRGCDAVVHLAAIVGDPACEENRPLAVEVNRVATQMLIEIGRGQGVNRFLFASSCSVYGASDAFVDERSALAPLSTYARTKIDSETIVLGARSPQFFPTVLRLATLFGTSPRMRFDLVVNLLVARAVNLGRITIFNGGQWRPLLHVRDAARAFVACLEANPVAVSGQVFNVGDDRLNHQLSDIAAKIISEVPGAEVEQVENEDRRNYRVSFSKIRSHIGFLCETTLEEGVAEIHRLLRSGDIADWSAQEFSNIATIRVLAQATGAAEPSSLRLLQSLRESE